jgi:hypothetical protein
LNGCYTPRWNGITQAPATYSVDPLSRLAAKSLALAEDIILFKGKAAVLPKIVRTANLASAQNGLVQDAANFIQVQRLANHPEAIFQAVVNGIAKLTALGQPGPYGLFLENSVYADTYRGPESEPLDTAADRIKPLLTQGFYPTGALLFPEETNQPQPFGLLASLGGEPVSIYVGVDAITEFMQTDGGGVLQFRVFERVQYVARDPSALIRFEFTN